jgi:spore germination protein
MYKQWSAWLFPVTALLLVAVTIWGYQILNEKNSILIKAENQYQRAFHELNEHVEQLHNELAKARLVQREAAQRKSLANIWRLANIAQNDISQLPLQLMPFHETQQLLHQISAFSYRASLRNLTEQPLSQNERKLLVSLQQRAGEISRELRTVQSAVMKNQLRWMDVEVALATENKQMDHTIIDGFRLVNEKVSEYEELDWGPSLTGKKLNSDTLAVRGKPLAEAQLKAKAAALIKGAKPSDVRLKRVDGRGVYHFVVKGAEDGAGNVLQLSKFNGEPIYFLNARPIAKQSLSDEQAVAAANSFFRKHGMPALEVVSYDKYGGVATITFVENRNKVLLYTNKLVVRVALDDGEVVGLQSELVYARVQPGNLQATLTAEEAEAELDSAFQVRSRRLALLENERNMQVLCYQFEGTLGDHYYRVFLNAADGAEEQIEMLTEVEL